MARDMQSSFSNSRRTTSPPLFIRAKSIRLRHGAVIADTYAVRGARHKGLAGTFGLFFDDFALDGVALSIYVADEEDTDKQGKN